jgi:hypothetical protein
MGRSFATTAHRCVLRRRPEFFDRLRLRYPSPPLSIAQEYNAAHRWAPTDYGGSSLAEVTKVAGRKGYSLVGCNIMGVNAFL